MPVEVNSRRWWEVWWGLSIILVVTGVVAGVIINWIHDKHVSEKAAQHIIESNPQGTQQNQATHETISQPQPDLPKPHPIPKPHMVVAGQGITIGDFSFIMKECGHVQGTHRCEGIIRDEADTKRQMTFTTGSAVDDKGNAYTLSNGPYLLFNPGILFFGSANVSQGLIPGIPVKFGFWMNFNREATAANFILKFTTSGTPAESEVTFKDIPILLE
jgi:hypothetical protein